MEKKGDLSDPECCIAANATQTGLSISQTDEFLMSGRTRVREGQQSPATGWEGEEKEKQMRA